MTTLDCTIGHQHGSSEVKFSAPQLPACVSLVHEKTRQVTITVIGRKKHTKSSEPMGNGEAGLFCYTVSTIGLKFPAVPLDIHYWTV